MPEKMIVGNPDLPVLATTATQRRLRLCAALLAVAFVAWACVGSAYAAASGDKQQGLTFLHARLLDPDLGRFISADPTVPTADNMGLNRYAYVGNSPVNGTDPSGYGAPLHNHLPGDECPGCMVNEVTGLPNRKMFSRAIKANADIKVLYGDGDLLRFKELNDLYGHTPGAGGDQVLNTVGERINAALGDLGELFHYGGDEFGIIFKVGVTEEQARAVLADAQARVKEPIPITVRGATFAVNQEIVFGLGASHLEASDAAEVEKTQWYFDHDLERRGHTPGRRAGDLPEGGTGGGRGLKPGEEPGLGGLKGLGGLVVFVAADYLADQWFPPTKKVEAELPPHSSTLLDSANSVLTQGAEQTSVDDGQCNSRTNNFC